MIEDGIERQIGPHDIHGVLHFDSGDARVTSELAAFAGIALKMIQDASGLRASEERLNLALRQEEMLTREMSHRVKNLFALAIGMVSISAKSAATPQDMAKTPIGQAECSRAGS